MKFYEWQFNMELLDIILGLTKNFGLAIMCLGLLIILFGLRKS